MSVEWLRLAHHQQHERNGRREPKSIFKSFLTIICQKIK